jgi:hypothetical protein
MNYVEMIRDERGRRVAIDESGNGSFTYSGIDRIDSSIGYIEGNVVSCCSKCNTAKSDMPFDEFRVWAIRLYEKLVRNQ